MDDTISRRQAIYVCLELMHERRKWLSDAGQKEINGIDAAMCAIRDLPSAQPTCNQLTTDCISRQAAINAVAEGLKHTFVENQDIAEKLIGKLPSAQSELENKIIAIGYTGKEGRIYIGGRLFAVRELAQ